MSSAETSALLALAWKRRDSIFNSIPNLAFVMMPDVALVMMPAAVLSPTSVSGRVSRFVLEAAIDDFHHTPIDVVGFPPCVDAFDVVAIQ